MLTVKKIVEVHCNLHLVDKIEENDQNNDNIERSSTIVLIRILTNFGTGVIYTFLTP